MSAKGRRRAEAPALFVDETPPAPVPVGGAHNFYPTEPWCVDALLESPLVTLPGGLWIEPCAGMGSIVRAVNAKRSDVDWLLCDIDERMEPHLRRVMRGFDILLPFGDFVHRPWNRSVADVLIMNPDFDHTEAFIAAAFVRARWVVMLQRVNWFGSQDRAPWLRRHCPNQYNLPKRPSFTGDGKTDATEYAWFVWPPGNRERRTGVIAMLDMPNGGQMELVA